MKKHPVDDLFKRKLTSLEKKPSESAWERIREGQENKSRRVAAWVWYAAASVTLALIAGYAVWQNQTGSFSEPAGTTELARIERKAPEQQVLPDSGLDKGSVQTGTLPEVLPEEKVLKPVQHVELAQIESEIKISKDKYPVPSKKEDEKTGEIISVKVIKTELAGTNNQPDQPEIQQTIIAEKVTAKQVQLAHQEEKQPDRTIVVEVEEPKNEFKDKKPSRLARVFRQLKNVREAEPVDWNEVGFNPKDIIARADDRPNDNDEKVSGKRERKN